MLYILTLTWNASEKLSKLKESLLPALDGIDYTWLIRDNASKDNTVEMASTWGNNFSTGMNYLFNEASPKDEDLVLLLNNDVVFNDINSIKNLLNIINGDKHVGVVGAKLLYTGTTRLQHAGVVFDSKHKMPMHYRLNQAVDQTASKNRLFQVVTGAVLLTKAEYFRNVFTNKSGMKGMDENYHWAFDDVDLCLSIKHNMKKKIVYCGETNIFHEESASLKKVPTNKLFMPHNTNYFLKKWNGKYLFDKDLYSKDVKFNLY